jgi:hypothetical protein
MGKLHLRRIKMGKKEGPAGVVSSSGYLWITMACYNDFRVMSLFLPSQPLPQTLNFKMIPDESILEKCACYICSLELPERSCQGKGSIPHPSYQL